MNVNVRRKVSSTIRSLENDNTKRPSKQLSYTLLGFEIQSILCQASWQAERSYKARNYSLVLNFH